MLVSVFIKFEMVDGIQQMTIQSDRVYAYLGFCLISQSIEFLGACLDSYPWDQKSISSERFRLAITKLFPDKYTDHAKGKYDLYSNLRCSLTHSLKPGISISLSERKWEKKAGLKDIHLKIQKEKLILIYEDFLDDFISACNRVLSMIEKGEINSDKIYRHIISVPSDKIT
jgi:hypothetical protein